VETILIVVLVAVLVLVLLGVLAHLFGSDSRMSTRDTRQKWW